MDVLTCSSIGLLGLHHLCASYLVARVSLLAVSSFRQGGGSLLSVFAGLQRVFGDKIWPQFNVITECYPISMYNARCRKEEVYL